MWFLYGVLNDEETTKTLLRPGLTYTLGRRDCDILPPVKEDKTISRKHATLEIEPIITQNWNEIDWKPYVRFKDLGSKCGSSMNSVPIEGVSLDQGAYMDNGDTLRIGTKTGLFRLSWEPLIICRQSMPASEKQKLLEGARTIGAKVTHLIRSPYTHLLTSTIQISFKVARCMAEGKPIISQSWLDAMVNLPDCGYTFPSVADHLPPLDTSCNGPLGIPDFTPNQARARLFTGKRFVFFEQKQYDQLSSMIETCNGDSVLLNVNKVDPLEEQLGNENTIVVGSASVYETHGWKNIINMLDSCGTRSIADTEICWAILYNSIEVECNTKFNTPSFTSASPNNAPTANTSKSELEYTSTKNVALSSSAKPVPSNVNPLPPSSTAPSSSSSSSSSSSPAVNVSHNANLVPSSSTAPPSSTNQRQLAQDHHQSPDKALSEPAVGKDLDLDDFFDQIVGDEPSRPPPTMKNLSSEPPINQAPSQTTSNHEMSDYHQNNNNLSSNEVGIEEQPTNEQQDTKKMAINKGKGRMHDPDTAINDDPMLNDDIENSSTGRKAKKPRIGKDANSTGPPSTPRKPFILPELQNENADITAGKNYTKVMYTTLVVAPSPPENWTVQQQPTTVAGGLNYKKFKKVNHQSQADPLLTVGMATGFSSDTVELEPLPENDEDDFSEIRIKPNAKRGAMWI